MSNFFVDPDIAKAKTIDADFYTSPDVFEACKEKIFAATWQFIGDSDLVKENGDTYPFTLLENYLDEPLLLTRDKAGQINLLSNVCTHRGNLVVDKPCKLNKLRCRYHGRMFGLDGHFVSMPEFKEVEDFPTKADDLHKAELFSWDKWLFTSLSPQAKLPAVADVFKDMMERMSWLPLSDFIAKIILKASTFLLCTQALMR